MNSLDRSQLSPDTSSANTQDLPKYLALREGVFYFKRKMPTDVARSASAKAQVWKSLNTRDFNEAVKRLDACLSEFDAAVAAARTKGSTGKRLTLPAPKSGTTKYLQESHIPALLERFEYFVLETDDDERRNFGELEGVELDEVEQEEWRRERLELMEEGLARLKKLAATENYSNHAEVAAQLLRDERLIAPPDSEPAKMLLKQLFYKDLELWTAQRDRLLGTVRSTPASVPVAPRDLPTLRDLHSAWRVSQGNPRTVDTYLACVTRFEGMHGALPVTAIQHRHVEKYRDELAKGGLCRSTVKNHLSAMSTLLTFGERTLRISLEHNVFAGVPLDQVPERDTGLDRRAYEMDELRVLFSSRLYTQGYLPKGQSRDAAYWLPLMGPFAGPRLEEAAQLLLKDIQRINGNWVIRIADLDENQELKTKSSYRYVPIHQELIRCGLLAYAARLKAAGETRLFPSLLNENKYKRFGTSFGSWFGRYLTSIGLTDPRLDYHSFRFNLKQRCSQSGIRDEVRDALSGHWLHQNPASRGYMRSENRQYPLPELVVGMNHLRYDELDLSHLYVADPLNSVDILR